MAINRKFSYLLLLNMIRIISFSILSIGMSTIIVFLFDFATAGAVELMLDSAGEHNISTSGVTLLLFVVCILISKPEFPNLEVFGPGVNSLKKVGKFSIFCVWMLVVTVVVFYGFNWVSDGRGFFSREHPNVLGLVNFLSILMGYLALLYLYKRGKDRPPSSS